MTTSTLRPPLRARRALTTLAAGVVALGALAAAPPPAEAVTASFAATGRVSVTSSGAQKLQSAGTVMTTSADGRYVAFSTSAELAGSDPGGQYDVYVRDRLGGVTRQASLTDADGPTGGGAQLCAMSRDGRYVAFVAYGDNMPVATDQVYVRDLQERTTTLVSVSSSEVPSELDGSQYSGIDSGDRCAISDDGRYVAFGSEDGDLAPNASGDGDVYRRDLVAGTTQLVNVGMGGEPNGGSWDVAMTGDGGTVAFTSEANNLVSGDSNGEPDVFVRILTTNLTVRVSVKSGGGQVDGPSQDPSITGDGLRVAFTSGAPDLIADDTNGYDDVFVRNRQADTTVRASLGDTGQLGSGGWDPEISDSGRYVTFSYFTPAVIPHDDNGKTDVLRRDLQANDTEYISVAHGTSEATDQGSNRHDISGDGTAVVFGSLSAEIVRNDTNGSDDVFVRDDVVATTPIAGRAAFITQQFQDFAGRAPTASELSSWKAKLDHGEVSPEEVVDSLAHSHTWSSVRAPVIRLYWAFFQRVPDNAGMAYWISEAQKGLSLPKMASKFAQSQEFKTKYGPLSNAGFVTAIYQNIFDRDPEPAGLAYWKGELDSGRRTRGAVMVGFSESAEGRLLLSPAVDSALVWLGMLRTVPPASWNIGGIAEGYGHGEPPEIIPQAILATTTYADRVGS